MTADPALSSDDTVEVSPTGIHPARVREPLPDKRAWLRARKIDMLYRQAPTAHAGSVLAALALVTALWPTFSHALLLAWFAAGLAVVAGRLFSRHRYLHGGDADNPGHEQICLAGVFVSGLYWGSASVLLFPPASPLLQAVLAMCVVGMTAAAVSALSVHRYAFMLFAVPALLPLAVRFGTEGTRHGYLLAALTVVFLAGVGYAAGANTRMVHRLFRLQYNNQALTRRLRHEATRDPLVNLLNLREFSRRLRNAGKRSLSDARCYALVFIDLDRFKDVNDKYGYAAGDSLLRQVAHRLILQTRDQDIIARVGGDEFAVLVDDCPRERAAEIGQRLLDAITLRSYRNGDHRIAVTASIGVAYAVPGEDRTDLVLQAADAACYAAKEAGRNCMRIRTAGPVLVTSGRFTLDQLAREA